MTITPEMIEIAGPKAWRSCRDPQLMLKLLCAIAIYDRRLYKQLVVCICTCAETTLKYSDDPYTEGIVLSTIQTVQAWVYDQATIEEMGDTIDITCDYAHDAYYDADYAAYAAYAAASYVAAYVVHTANHYAGIKDVNAAATAVKAATKAAINAADTAAKAATTDAVYTAYGVIYADASKEAAMSVIADIVRDYFPDPPSNVSIANAVLIGLGVNRCIKQSLAEAICAVWMLHPKEHAKLIIIQELLCHQT